MFAKNPPPKDVGFFIGSGGVIKKIYFAFLLLLDGCASHIPRAGVPVPDTPFESYVVKDNLGRQVHYYLSAKSQEPLPLILFIADSGCESNFWRKSAPVVGGGYQDLFLEQAAGRAHVMV